MAMKSSFRDVTGREETGGGEVHNCQDGCPKTIEITRVIKKVLSSDYGSTAGGLAGVEITQNFLERHYWKITANSSSRIL